MSFDKFRVLLWKNWTLQRRRPVGGAIQILFPILVVVLATWARSSFGNQYGLLDRTLPQTIELKNFSLCTYINFQGTSFPLKNVHFMPNNEAFSALINDAFGDFTVIGHDNASEMYTAVYSGDEHQIGIELTSDSEVSHHSLSDVT